MGHVWAKCNALYMYIQHFYSATRMRTVTSDGDTFIHMYYTTNNHNTSYYIFHPKNIFQNDIMEFRTMPQCPQNNPEESIAWIRRYLCCKHDKTKHTKTVCLFNGIFAIHIPGTSLTNMLSSIAGCWYVITRIVFCWMKLLIHVLTATGVHLNRRWSSGKDGL